MCTIDTDMRQGRNGLSGIVTDHMKFNALDPKTIYIFFNKRRNQVKLLLWEKDGHSVYQAALMRFPNLIAMALLKLPASNYP